MHHPLNIYRKEHHLTQAALGALLDLPQGFISRWESGDIIPKRSTFVLLANELDIEPLQFERQWYEWLKNNSSVEHRLRLRAERLLWSTYNPVFLWRVANRKSMIELSQLVGLDNTTICHYELGKHFPSLKRLAQLSQVLELDEAQLFKQWSHWFTLKPQEGAASVSC